MTTGSVKFRFSDSFVAFRHGSSVPTIIAMNITTPIGMTQVLNQGGPIVIFSPPASSLSFGKSVPQSTTKAIPISTQLLARKAVSRETGDSRSRSDASDFHRQAISATLNRVKPIKIVRKSPPTSLSAKVCTELISPERVM